MPKEPNVDPVTPFVGVTTASGQTGRYLVREFARRGIRVRGLVRSTRAADAAREAGAFETAQADLADRESMAAALACLIQPASFKSQMDELRAKMFKSCEAKVPTGTLRRASALTTHMER